MGDGTIRSETVRATVTPAERKRIEREAKKDHRTVSDFIRLALLDHLCRLDHSSDGED